MSGIDGTPTVQTLPDWHGGWLARLDALNEERAQTVYAAMAAHGWPQDKQSSLHLAYETPEVAAVEAKIAALKAAFAADPDGEPPLE